MVTPQIRPPQPVDFYHKDIKTEVKIGRAKAVNPLIIKTDVHTFS